MRLLLSLLLIAAAVAGAVWLAERPGEISLVWQGWQVQTSLAVALVVLVLAIGLAWGLLWLLGKLIGAPRRARLRWRASRQLLGYRVLTDGLVAIAAGDGKQADQLRRRAERLFQQGRLDMPPLAHLLAAQAALLRGDDGAAKERFGAMLDNPDTEFLGLRGLIVQALKVGDDATALSLTERAKRLRPATSWVLQSQLALETRAGEWRRAQETLTQAVKRGALTAEQGRHAKATLLIARSREAVADGRQRDGLNQAAQAWGLDQSFAPAAIDYARCLADGGKNAKAIKVLETAWSRNAHPAIAEALGRLSPDEAPGQRLKRFEKLAALRSGTPDGHLAAAAVALTARLWGEARRHLDSAGANGPGPWRSRLCRLMAELEDGERNDAAAARLWLERAASAPAEPTWVCGSCSAETPEWAPLCPSCHSFDSLAWQVPDRTAARAHAAAAPALDLSPNPVHTAPATASAR